MYLTYHTSFHAKPQAITETGPDRSLALMKKKWLETDT